MIIGGGFVHLLIDGQFLHWVEAGPLRGGGGDVLGVAFVAFVAYFLPIGIFTKTMKWLFPERSREWVLKHSLSKERVEKAKNGERVQPI